MRNHMKHRRPGGHEDMERCPLCGAAKAIAMMDGAAMLIIGTEECTYYTKSTLEMRGMGADCFSVVLDKNDVTFGSLQKVTEAVEELFLEYKPKELFLVTTCVVEVIGDDFTALAQDATERYGLPVHIIQTNHFQGKDAEYGFDLVMKSGGESSRRGVGRSVGKHKMFFGKIKRKLGGRR